MDKKDERFPFIEGSAKGLFIRVRLQPRASRNFLDGMRGGALKVRLTAPPVEGEANRALIDFLSGLLGLRKSSFSIDSGLKSRDKRVRVEEIGEKELKDAFSRALA